MARTKSIPGRKKTQAPGRLLLDALKHQQMVGGNTSLALELASKGELIGVEAGAAIIEQGGDDNAVYFIVAGTFDIVVNGKLIAKRFAADHVGEMAAVHPAQSRSAAVIAAENSIVLKMTEPQLAALGTRYPEIYRLMAKELAKRVLQRNSVLAGKRSRIRLFILASAEDLKLAKAVQKAFESDPYEVVIWTEGVFRASNYAIENLEYELDQSDFAIVIAQPGKDKTSHRDNVIFELGLFIGRLGRHRSLLLEPRGEAMKLPSDLTGLTTIRYEQAKGTDLPAALAPACSRIRNIISELGQNS